jgi:NhaP-type Na+/H+ and K+/H+ antiporter
VVVRDGTLLTVTGDTTLRGGDDVLLLADPEETAPLERYFTTPTTPDKPRPRPEDA